MTLSSRIHDLTTAVAAAINARAGKIGASAYDLAVLNGFVGTQGAWLASLKALGTTTVSVPTNTMTGWNRQAASGTMTSDGTELVLVNATAGQFVRYYCDNTRLLHPMLMCPVVLQFDVKIDDTPAARGGSAGMTFSSTGELGNFCVRLDVDATGKIGCRFETDQSSNLQSFMPAPGPTLSLGTWITVRMVRLGGSGAAFINGYPVLGVDSGPAWISSHDAPTILMFGGTTAGMTAHFRNIAWTVQTGP